MKFNEIVEALSSQGRRKTDPMMVEVTLLYYGSILFNRYGYRKDIKHLKRFVNMYVIMLASSAAGKGYILHLVESICNLDNYADQMEVMYEFFTEQMPGVEIDPDIYRFLPTSPTVSIDGSKEGLFNVAEAVVSANHGSLNLFHEELADVITSSNELLNMLKLAYDGQVKHKIIKGEKGDKRKSDINGITTNFIGAGSIDAIGSEAKKALVAMAVSGIYRRSYCVDSKIRPESNSSEPVDLNPVREHFAQIDKIHKDDYRDRVNEYGTTGTTEKIFSISNDALEMIEKIDKWLMKRANDNQLNAMFQYDVGALNSIVNAAYIICYIEGRLKVTIDDMSMALSVFKRTRETVLDTFRETRPHNEIYDILKKKSNMTHSELMDVSPCECIPKAKGAFADTVLLVHELCYRNGEVLKTSKGVVTRYSIEELPRTNLDKLILSLSTDDKRQYAIAFEPVEMKWSDLPKLAVSHFRAEPDEDGELVMLGVESFTTAHYDPSSKTDPYGHRQLSTFIHGQNVIAFDMDDGQTTIADIKEKFANFKYLLYTTKSHQTIKGNYCDRFRVIVPCATSYSVNPEEHKLMYRAIAEFFDIHPDVKAYNVSRLLYTNKDAEVYVNDVDELFDVQPFLPDTNRAKELLKNMKDLKEVVIDDDDELQRRISGFVRYQVATLHVGNLKSSIHNTFMFVKDLTGSEELACQAVESVQSATGYPQRFLDTYYRDHRIER